jgi:hypothetical protein
MSYRLKGKLATTRPTARQMPRLLRSAGALLAVGGLAWATHTAVTWLGYGHPPRTRVDGEDPLDSFLPEPEVDEQHQTRVAAPAALALRAARELDLRRSPLVRLIFALRTLPSRLRGGSVRWEAPKLVEGMLGIGWGVLIDAPGELFVAGAVTQPWVAEVKFQALAPEKFAGFDEPGYAKIVWTLEAEAVSEHESIARTRTRVKTTDPAARRRFRRYWAVLSPGILLIHYEILRLARQEAERLAAIEAR